MAHRTITMYETNGSVQNTNHRKKAVSYNGRNPRNVAINMSVNNANNLNKFDNFSEDVN